MPSFVSNLEHLAFCAKSSVLIFPCLDLVENARKVNKRHLKEIKATYMAFAIIVTFAVLNLPRLIASTIEVINTNQIIHCVDKNYVPHKQFYLLDFVARICMILNSATNFLVYCAISTPFQVRYKSKYIFTYF